MHATEQAVYWHETEPVEVGEPLPGDLSCDVCIIGGGYTGLWSAHFLKEAEPSADIHVLESDYAGSGASGLAGGFLYLAPGKVLRRLLWYYGRDKAAGVYKSTARSIVEIGRFCRQHGIDAGYEPSGMLQIVTNAKQLARLELQTVRANRTGLAGSFKLLDQAEAQQRIGSPMVRGALKTSGAVVNPHRLVRGLARVVRDQGVTIHERTAVTEVRRVGDHFQVSTARGTVTAREVVVATGAWQHMFPELHKRVMPVWSYAMVTEPLPDEQLGRVAWPGREGLADLSNFSIGARLTPDNRVVWTGGRWHYRHGRDMNPAHAGNGAAYAELRRRFAEFFPDWRDVGFTHQYAGCLDWSRNFIPQFGRTASGLVYAHGYTGNGLATSHTGGKIVRDLVLRRQTEYTEHAFVTVHQLTFMPGRTGDLAADFFVWRQEVGDKIPLLLPHRAAITPRAYFAARATRRSRATPSRP
ncbi:MAG TPA: FAD-dependent oxidoreductase [Rugosimonospora sp.]|nr:FAD-dependent oxidoreductase [Rugosimonospora sp.]